MEEVSIKLSKTKMLLALVGCIVFTFLGVYLWQIAYLQNHYLPIYVRSVSVADLVLFGGGSFFILFKLFDNTPGILLNTEGFSFVGGHLIKWSDIKNIGVYEIKKTKLILIFVHNPEYYISQASTLKRFSMKFGEKYYGTPLTITSAALQCSFKELLNLIETSRTKYSN